MKVLISGAKSGIGKFLVEELGATGLTRQNAEEILDSNQEYDVIIHCAFNSSKSVNFENINNYFDDNVELTKKILGIKHRKAIHFSTIDIYPKNIENPQEDSDFNAMELTGIYAVFKMLSESIVRNESPNNVVFRPSLMVGKYARPNTVTKIINNESVKLSLSSDSEFNIITYDQVLSFIKEVIEKDHCGVFNLVSTENILLSEVRDIFGSSLEFGDYKYVTNKIDNEKINSLSKIFNKTSKEVLKEYMT